LSFLAEGIEVVAGGFAEMRVKLFGGLHEVAAGGPEGGVELLLPVRGGGFELFLLQPVLQGFLLGGEKACLIDLRAPLLPHPLHLRAEGGDKAQGGDAVGGELGRLPQGALDGNLPVAELVVERVR
jgi:hypothetical protein